MAEYMPVSAGVAEYLRSEAVHSHMADIGTAAAALAQTYATDAATITSTTTTVFGRWVTIVTMDAYDAIIQEFGGRNVPPRAPLGRVLNEIRRADPHRKQQIISLPN
jgi:hypothetical protein